MHNAFSYEIAKKQHFCLCFITVFLCFFNKFTFQFYFNYKNLYLKHFLLCHQHDAQYDEPPSLRLSLLIIYLVRNYLFICKLKVSFGFMHMYVMSVIVLCSLFCTVKSARDWERTVLRNLRNFWNVIVMG